MNASLADLSRSATSATTLEELARPLLKLLHAATGLESAYLTSIAWPRASNTCSSH